MPTTQEFLASIFEGTTGFLELRLIAGTKVSQHFFPVENVLVPSAWTEIEKRILAANERGANIYFGVNPRTDKVGDADHVSECRVIWCDIDTHDAEVIRRNFAPLRGLGIEPNIVVDSGHGYHAYWLLKEAVPTSEAEKVMREIARVLGGDKTYDAPRILRLPETVNHKPPPARCRIVKWNGTERKYSTLDFDALSDLPSGENPKKPAAPARAAQAPATLTQETYENGHAYCYEMARVIAQFWGEGSRHQMALGVAGLLRRDEVREEDAVLIVEKIAELTSDREIEDRVRAVKSTYQLPAQDVAASKIIAETLGERAQAFWKGYDAVKELIPPPPCERSGLPDFRLYECVRPGSLFDRYVLHASEKMDAPIQYHAASILTVAAAALGNNVCHPDFHGSKLYPNLYTLVCGPSTRFRKTRAISLAKEIGKAAKVNAYPHNATVELLYAKMAPNECDWREEPRSGNRPPKRIPIAWEGRPAGVIFHQEFAHFLAGSAKSYMQDVRAFFMDIYDGAPGGESRETKTQGRYLIEDAAISMLAGVSLAAVKRFVASDDIQNGFLPRFLVILHPATHVNKYGFNPSSKDGLDARYQISSDLEKLTKISGEVVFTLQAQDAFAQLDEELHRRMERYESGPQEILCSFLGRLSAMAVKVAMVYGCEKNRSPLVDDEDMAYAANLIRYSASCLENFFDEIQSDEGNWERRYEEAVIRSIRLLWRKGVRPVPRRLAIKNSNLTSNQFDTVVRSAVQKGIILLTPRGRGPCYTLNEVERKG